MATAGMRLLDVESQDKILEEFRKVLRVSGFKFHDDWASVITGSDEGVYAWVVANHALGTLGGNPRDTTGIIELGGASAQVTFVSSEHMPSKFSRTIKFGNFTYNLYSHSFLHFGQDVAHESLRESLIRGDFSPVADSLQKEMNIDPCTPKGYLPQSSDVSLDFMAEKEKCSAYHCYLGSVFMPKLQGKFLATENFFHTSKFFRLHQRAFLSDLMMAGQHFCGEDWSKLKKKHQSLDEEELLRYCFSSAYTVALLHDSLGIGLDDERISLPNQVENIPLDWALGAFILQTTAKLDVQQSNSSFFAAQEIEDFFVHSEEIMSDHLVLNVNGLVKPEPVEYVAVPSEEIPGPSRLSDSKEKEVVSGDEEEPLIQSAECRICQDEDSIKNLETPCACSGSLKYAHRKCVQHWCNEKGNINCEICHQPYQPDYTAVPRAQTEETTIDIGGVWTISGTPLDLRDPRLLAIAEAERQFLETEYDEYATSNASGAAFCRSAALILMALLLLRHALNVPDADSDDDVSTVFTIFLIRAGVFLLPCYIMAWAISILQRRRQRQEAAAAATQVAFVLQSGQHRGMHFTIASGTTVTPQQTIDRAEDINNPRMDQIMYVSEIKKGREYIDGRLGFGN
ncbi:hypothetical protein V6N13_099317 [Hibiscus sabdariffa]